MGQYLLISTQYFPKLYHFNASVNEFEGGIPPPLFGEMSSVLQILDLSSNRLHGEIPTTGMNMSSSSSSSSMEYLKLSNNFLQGKMLPAGNISMPKLKWLFLRGNNFTEMNPHSLSKCSSLRILDVRENSLSSELSTLLPTTLMILLLRNNHLQGPIPEQLCQMKQLRILDLAENNLSDAIPSCLHNITSWTTEARARLGMYSSDSVDLFSKGMLYSYRGEILNFVTGMDVSCNQLTGTIPIQVGELSGIHILNMSRNLLTGPIPTSFQNLVRLESLDLSHNNLSGAIPPELGDYLNFLAVFTVAFNNLSGSTPQRKGQFGTFDRPSYMGNPGLCGLPLETKCSSSKIPAAAHESGTTAAAILVMVELSFLVLVIFL